MKTYQIVNTFRYETKQTRSFIRVREIHLVGRFNALQIRKLVQCITQNFPIFQYKRAG